jgi:hypothetical protein
VRRSKDVGVSDVGDLYSAGSKRGHRREEKLEWDRF